MPTRKARLEQTKRILDKLSQENIVSLEIANRSNCIKLDKFRNAIWETAQARKVFSPGLTSSAAVTLLKVAGCNELSQRFILEYCLSVKIAEAKLVFLANAHNPRENHAFVLLGEVRAPKELFGQGSFEVSTDRNPSISEFLKIQEKNTVMVDPLLGSFGDSDSIAADLTTYCGKHGITHVTAIVEYGAPVLIEQAETIKANAVMLAAEVNKDQALKLLDDINRTILRRQSLETWKFHSQNQYFYVKGTEAAVREAQENLQPFFTKGELHIVRNAVNQNNYLIINQKAHQLDYAKLLDIADSHLEVSEAMARHSLVFSAPKSSSVQADEKSTTEEPDISENNRRTCR